MKTKQKNKDRHRASPIRANGAASLSSAKRQTNKAESVVTALDPATVLWLWRAKIIGLTILCAAFLWAYWPTVVQLVQTWNREPDYSHGFLVLPLAVYFLWNRRDRRPPINQGLAWPGLLLIAFGTAIRMAGVSVYIDSVDGWSIILWVAGVVWLLGGGRLLAWSWSSIAFLWFMVPLPFRAEGMISYPLQRIATKLSCWMLQFLAQPALAEGNTILLGEHRLAVEEACSGLRIFMSIIALAFAYIIVMRRAWWERLLILASTLPIALIVNAIRIVATGLLTQYTSSEMAAKFSHDLAGWVMIPMAAAMFGFVLWYIGKMFPHAELVNIQSVVRIEKAHT